MSEEVREFMRSLLREGDETSPELNEQPPEPLKGNRVPAEGRHLEPQRDLARDFILDLLGHDG